MYPSAPAFGVLRLASLTDVPRIAVVATSGFRYSPVFQWERPYHQKYPEDTLMSYQSMFAERIKNPEYIVLVASDAYEPDENNKTSAIIPPDNATVPARGENVIAGVASWKLEMDSSRMGQFQTQDLNCSIDFPKGPERDKHKAHIAAFDEVCDAAEEKYFVGHSLVDMVVVDPAYWKRGHGSALVGWGMTLADTDQVRQGVLAPDMGAKLYLDLGYDELCIIGVKGDEDAQDGISNVVARYSPKRRSMFRLVLQFISAYYTSKNS